MTHKLSTVLVFFLCICMTGCGLIYVDKQEATTAYGNLEGSTGYASGDIQRSFVYYNGITYVYDDNTMLETLPENTEYVGGIIQILTDSMPTKNLEATCLNKGYKVYIAKEDSEIIYVFNGETYQKFIKYTPA